MKKANLKISVTISVFIFILIFGCTEKSAKTEEAVSQAPSQVEEENPAMKGFNVANSDKKAIDLADEVMKAMGGRQAWDKAHYFVWDFFGGRRLYWDKWNGNVRIEFLKNDTKILLNIHDLKGKVFKDGQELTSPDSLKVYLNRGKNIWINDSYWLVMPFKLKDSGVTLTYSREDTLGNGKSADVLALTFEEVGVTPQNKYEVFIDKQDNLIKQWTFFRQANQDSANFIRPWDNYKDFGGLLLSGNRSDNGGPTDVHLLDSLPTTAFTTFDPVDLNQLD